MKMILDIWRETVLKQYRYLTMTDTHVCIVEGLFLIAARNFLKFYSTITNLLARFSYCDIDRDTLTDWRKLMLKSLK